MIIGSEFNKKSRNLLKEIGRIADDDKDLKLSVQEINESVKMDRTEIKNLLEYLDELGYIKIVTIGGPLLYGHVRITSRGVKKYHELRD